MITFKKSVCTLLMMGLCLIVPFSVLLAQTAQFSEGEKYGNGIRTSVAINENNVAVEVHQSENHKTLWCRVGTATPYGINWSTSVKYDNGVSPSVAINNDGKVIEVHKSENNSGLWYRVGTITGTTIKWSASQKYDNGNQPSVALNNDGTVIETHQSENNDKLWVTSGEIIKIKLPGTNTQVSSLQLGEAVKFDKGKGVDVACNRSLAIQTHKSENKDVIWGSTSLIVDRANWMGNTPGLMNRPLWQVTLPGSHDSGTYKLSNKTAPGQVPLSNRKH